jgi:hypothetical protein
MKIILYIFCMLFMACGGSFSDDEEERQKIPSQPTKENSQ